MKPNIFIILLPWVAFCLTQPTNIDIRDEKIWIQRDLTEQGVASELVELGVPKTDIVLGFKSPYIRQFTDFAQG